MDQNIIWNPTISDVGEAQSEFLGSKRETHAASGLGLFPVRFLGALRQMLTLVSKSQRVKQSLQLVKLDLFSGSDLLVISVLSLMSAMA